MKKVHLLFACLFMIVQHVSSQIPMGITVAGGNGQGSAASQLAYPVGIFVDRAANIYIGDAINNRIQKWAPGATAGITVAGGNGPGSAANQLFTPTIVFIDMEGNIYIADANNSRIQKWAPGASAGITVAGGNGHGSAANQFAASYGVFVDPNGYIYVADFSNHRIQKWAPGATAGITVAGGNGQGSGANQLNNPRDVFVDINGNIFICDPGNHRIQRWAPGASAGVTVAGGNGRGSAVNQLAAPLDVFVDVAGNIYVADQLNHRIQKWAPGASAGITVAGDNGPGIAPYQLHDPAGVFVDPAGNIYVADQVNSRIQKFVTNNIEYISCPPDLTVTATSCNDRATITWDEPRDTFPATITIPEQLHPGKGTLTYIGALDGHGYYRSTGQYLWPAARDIARRIGGTGVNGHLVTLSSPAENALIYNNVKGTGYSPWIGLFNTGRPGRFRWVNNEALTYTNWAPGEPNNAGGDQRNVAEPYVRFSAAYNNWNDQRNDNLPFITEFEKPLIRYRQISGPRNGSERKAGEYLICYERTNLILDETDTCCFRVTVTCKPRFVGNDIHSPDVAGSSESEIGKSLQVSTTPNPSSDLFRLRLTGSNSQERVSVTVSDITGRIIDVRNGLAPNQTLNIGRNLKPGMYFIRVTQGSSKAVVKIIKL